MTSSLFGTTLLVSFLVVAMPHIVPCPAPRVAFAEGEFEVMEDGRRRRRRRQHRTTMQHEESGENVEQALGGGATEDHGEAMRKRAHECPIPKPRGLIGEVFGFKKQEVEQEAPKTIVETRKAKGR